MIAALLLAAAAFRPPSMPSAPSPRDAQRIGQWTAFRKYADRDAVMFTPQAVWAREFLKGRKDPPKAIALAAGAQLRLVRRADGGQHRPVVRAGRQARAAISRPYGSATGGQWRWVYDGGGPLGGAGAATAPGRSVASRRLRDARRPARRSSRRRR